MGHFYGWDTADVRDPKQHMTPRDFYDMLLDCWCVDTCAPRMQADWSPENITLGQCSVTAFLLQDYFGGEVRGIPLADGSVHCFNVVDGCLFDLTSEQFGSTVLDYSLGVPQSREAHFAKHEKEARYHLLRARFLARLYDL